jgi:filamentous hemagglutinin
LPHRITGSGKTPETQLDRITWDLTTRGSYLSPVGTPLTERALAPGSFADMYNQYVVLKPFTVERSSVAPAFGEFGNGIQYKIPNDSNGSVSIQYLLDNRYIGVKK